MPKKPFTGFLTIFILINFRKTAMETKNSFSTVFRVVRDLYFPNHWPFQVFFFLTFLGKKSTWTSTDTYASYSALFQNIPGVSSLFQQLFLLFAHLHHQLSVSFQYVIFVAFFQYGSGKLYKSTSPIKKTCSDLALLVIWITQAQLWVTIK